MLCPACASPETRVIDTTPDGREIRRRRSCLVCNERFTTLERVRLDVPIVVKVSPAIEHSRREAFDREKLRLGIRAACAKRPISADAIDGLIDHVERCIRSSGLAEITSHQIGEKVIEGLRELDEVAYMRYAIVFLGLEDLTAVRREIDRLLTEHQTGILTP